MSDIHNSDIQKRIMEEAKLQLSVDKVPTQLAEKVVPVLISNPKGKKKIFIYRDSNTRNISTNGLYVPVGKKWKFNQIFILLQTDATVADRNLEILCYPDHVSEECYWYRSHNAVAASSNGIYNFIEGANSGVIASPANTHFFTVPIPTDFTLYEGGNLWVSVTGIVGGDTLNFYCVIEETDLLQEEKEFKVVG